MKRTIINFKSQYNRLHSFPLFRRAELLVVVLAAMVAILTICLIVKSCAQQETKQTVETTEAVETTVRTLTLTVVPAEETTSRSSTVSIPIVWVPRTEEATEPETVAVTEPQESAWDRAFREAKASVNMADARILALCIQGEAALAWTTAEKAAVAWVILNAIECKEHGFANLHSISDVVKNPAAIQGYTTLKRRGVEPEAEYLELAIDVLARYAMECAGWEYVGRVIPDTYHWWMGDGYHRNYFCDVYHYGSLATAKANAWDWSWTSPYED